jgi:hypothetical protein
MSPKDKPDKELWIVLHHHKHGVDAYPLLANGEPSQREAIEALKPEMDFEEGVADEDGREYLDIIGPWLDRKIKEVP